MDLSTPQTREFQFRDMNGLNLAIMQFTLNRGETKETYEGEGESMVRVIKGDDFVIRSSNFTYLMTIEAKPDLLLAIRTIANGTGGRSTASLVGKHS